MKRTAILVIFLGAASLGSNCDEITTTSQTKQLTVSIAPSSTVVDASGEFLVRDQVDFNVFISEGSSMTPAPARFRSSELGVVEILDDTAGTARLVDLGTSTVTATITDPTFGADSLQVRMEVAVDSFVVQIAASSPTLDAGGGFVVGDVVDFSATVTRASDSTPVTTSGAQFSADDPSILDFTTATQATVLAPGPVVVSVQFDEPVLPGGAPPPTSNLSATVSDLSVALDVESVITGPIDPDQALLTDTLRFIPVIMRNGEEITPTGLDFTSSAPSVVQFTVADTAVLVAEGQSTVTMTFSDPVLPVQQATADVRVGTFAAEIMGNQSPTMGNTETYTFTVTDTRDGSVVPHTVMSFESSDLAVLEITDELGGEAFARDIGTADVTVTFSDPRLPAADVTASLEGINIAEELFYGSSTAMSGIFGDTVTLSSSVVHTFTDSTLVQFSDGTVGFVDLVDANSARFIVGAGNDVTAPITLQNLEHVTRGDTDGILTNFNFVKADSVDDMFEPNNAFPLNAGLEINEPFQEILSISAAGDTNYVYLDLTGGGLTVDVTVDWQQDADINFFICNGDANPPTMLVAGCARDDADNSTDRSMESEPGLSLGVAIHVIAFYCVDCLSEPVTYRAIIQQP